MNLLAVADPIWRWRAHPEVWLLVAGACGLWAYTRLVIAPRALPGDTPAFTRRQIIAFVAGVAVLWFSSDWPLHDIAEQRLYSAHMFQHLLLTLIVPPLFWLATPPWLAELVLPVGGRGRRILRSIARPVPAALVFNLLNLSTHVPWVVNTAVVNGPFHYSVHLILVSSAFVMWIPIVGPWPELRLTLPAQMIYLFLMSVIPTVPAAFFASAENVVYPIYDHGPRLWGISALDDQVTAGLVMKLAETTYLWTWITGVFFTWAGRNLAADRQGIVGLTERDLMTFEPAASTGSISDGTHGAGQVPRPAGTSAGP